MCVEKSGHVPASTLISCSFISCIEFLNNMLYWLCQPSLTHKLVLFVLVHPPVAALITPIHSCMNTAQQQHNSTLLPRRPVVFSLFNAEETISQDKTMSIDTLQFFFPRHFLRQFADSISEPECETNTFFLEND